MPLLFLTPIIAATVELPPTPLRLIDSTSDEIDAILARPVSENPPHRRVRIIPDETGNYLLEHLIEFE